MKARSERVRREREIHGYYGLSISDHTRHGNTNCERVKNTRAP